MDFLLYLRRSLFAAIAIGAAAALGVYLLHEWHHQVLLPWLGLSSAAGDALGTLFIVIVIYAALRLVSISIYRDWLFGLSNALKTTDGRSGAQGSAAAQVSTELDHFPKFNDVVRNQLAIVTKETEEAAYNVVTRLQSIDEVITNLSSFVDSISHESDELLKKADQRIQHNKTLIIDLDRYIDQRVRESQEDQQRVAQVVTDAKSLTSLVLLIKHIAGQTNLLALNAAIEAARAGEAGRGFAVVADEVRKLSGESEKAVHQINAGIESVAASIQGQFAEKLAHSNIESERTALQTFANQISELGASYQEVTEHEHRVLNQVHESSAKLNVMFMDALASIQFQDVTRQQVEQVANALNRLDTQAGLLARKLREFDNTSIEITPLAEHLDEIYSSYVMSSQRQTHNDALQSGRQTVESAGPKVELF